MIVIAIIGVLAAALYPSLTSYLSRAEDTRIRLRVTRIAGALESYSIANDTWIIPGAYGGGSGSIDYDPTLAVGPTLIPTTYAAGEPSTIRKLEIAGYLSTGYVPQTNDITKSRYVLYGCNDKTFSVGSKVTTQNKTDILELSYACNGVINTAGVAGTMATNVTTPMNTAITRGSCELDAGATKNCEGLTLPSGGGYSVGDAPPSGYCWMITIVPQPYTADTPTYQVGAFAHPVGVPYDNGNCMVSCGGGASSCY